MEVVEWFLAGLAADLLQRDDVRPKLSKAIDQERTARRPICFVEPDVLSDDADAGLQGYFPVSSWTIGPRLSTSGPRRQKYVIPISSRTRTM